MNELEIRKALDILKPINKLDGKQPIIEVRIIGNKTYSGYFRDIDKLIESVKPYNNDNIYFTINEIDEACYSREQCEKIIQSGNRTKTTSDSDISARDYILIDIDPKRASGVSANDEELDHAKQIGRKVYSFLRDQGFTKPISAFSGNGFHFLYKVDLANSPENTELVKNFLLTLDMLFSDDYASVDAAVFNASRITKLYGTYSRKGANTEDRPHRISQIISAPDKIEVLDKAFIQKVVKLLPKEEPKSWKNNYQGNGQFDLDEFIARNKIDVKKRVTFNGGEKLIIDCPFDENHKGDGAIFKLNNGALGYKCFHNGCSHRSSWEAFREHFEPNRRSRSDLSFNRYSGANKYVKQDLKPQEETEEKGKKFLKLSEIKEKDRSEIVSVPTGFIELDKKIIGLNLGELSIVSGINGSGKSALIKQLCLNAVNLDYNVLEYSGELDATRSKSWTTLQAAGRLYTEPTKYENYFRVPERISNLISEWIGERWLVYNNDYSNNLSQLLVDIEEQLEQRDTHIVIVDNIMSLEISDLGGDKYENQKKAVWELKQLAMKYKVHVIIVAHPRKSMGFLRKEDIAGSGDMINLAENIFIVHRVNNDFIRRFPEFYGEDKAAPFLKYGNVFEVAKNRDLGIVDYFVGLYYEIESKRFLNEFTDTPYYGWQELLGNHQSDISFSYLNQSELEQQFLSEPLTSDQIPF